jgi:polysaccharide export outer membrane protein
MKTLVALFLAAAAAAQSPVFADRDPHYRLQPEDKVEVQYRYTPEYNAAAALQPDGYVSLPLVGEVKLADLTLREAEHAIAAKAGERLADPEVTVLLKDYVKPYFVVAGEVARPGRFELHGRVGLIEAIAISGGLKDSAKRTQVIVFHKTSPELAEAKVYDVRKLMSASNVGEDITVRSGDLVVVPRNLVSRIEPYVRISEGGLTAALSGVLLGLH